MIEIEEDKEWIFRQCLNRNRIRDFSSKKEL